MEVFLLVFVAFSSFFVLLSFHRVESKDTQETLPSNDEAFCSELTKPSSPELQQQPTVEEQQSETPQTPHKPPEIPLISLVSPDSQHSLSVTDSEKSTPRSAMNTGRYTSRKRQSFILHAAQNFAMKLDQDSPTFSRSMALPAITTSPRSPKSPTARRTSFMATMALASPPGSPSPSSAKPEFVEITAVAPSPQIEASPAEPLTKRSKITAEAPVVLSTSQLLLNWYVENAPARIKQEPTFFTFSFKKDPDSPEVIRINETAQAEILGPLAKHINFATIKHATTSKLIEKLVFTSDKESESYCDLRDIFFATYTSFISPDELLDALVSIYVLHGRSDCSVAYSVVATLDYWLTHYLHDLSDDTLYRVVRFVLAMENTVFLMEDIERLRITCYSKVTNPSCRYKPTSYPLAVDWDTRIKELEEHVAKTTPPKEEQSDEEEEMEEEAEGVCEGSEEENEEEENQEDQNQDEEYDEDEGSEDGMSDASSYVSDTLDNGEPIYPEGWNEKAPFNLLEWSPKEIARQLTLIDEEYLKNIQARELLSGNYSAKNMDQCATNISAMISHFNALSKWIVKCILSESSIEHRVEILSYIVEVVESLASFSNFNTIMSIHGALNQLSIHRLKKTWELVPEDQTQALLMLQELLAPTKKFKNLKDALDQIRPPCIPYIGLFLADLATLESVTEDIVKEPSSSNVLINVNKKRVSTKVIRHIQSYQNYSYSFKKIDYLQNYFKNEFRKDLWTDEMELQQSLILEPKKKASVSSSDQA